MLGVVSMHCDALTVQLTPGQIPPSAWTAMQALLGTVIAQLPKQWRRQDDVVIRLTWSGQLPPRIHGRSWPGTIVLNTRLLVPWLASGAPVSAPTSEPIRSALIHELAHQYDVRHPCRLSCSQRFLALAGWQRAVWWPRWQTNPFSRRSVDPYERHSPAEFVAVNLEHWVLDPSYPCRRPLLAAWWTAQLGVLPLPPRRCAWTVPLVESDGDQGQARVVMMDPRRIYAVDLLYARGGGQPASWWGHCMLRLVICAPGHPLGPACRFDIADHRVFSFRAFVGGVLRSNWRGLIGRYPSRLSVIPLDSVIDDYTKLQRRDLVSIPLALHADEVRRLLWQAAQVQWSYAGRYYFLSNNCATETARLLQVSVARLAQMPKTRFPQGLTQRLKHAHIADSSVITHRQFAIEHGYLFESSTRYEAQLLDIVRQSGQAIPNRVQAWLTLPPRQRAALTARLNLSGTAAALLLEKAALYRAQTRAQAQLVRHLRHHSGSSSAIWAAIAHDQDRLSAPASLLDQGYGIPQDDELAQLRTRLQDANDTLARHWQMAQHLVPNGLSPDLQQQMATIVTNIRGLQQRLQQLAQSSGS